MQSFAEDVLGHGTPIAKEIVQLVHGLGADDAHLAPITDPLASRQTRIDTRREWPDSPMSDVPDRYALFHLMGNVDLMTWPELGTAIDDHGRVAAHLRDAASWVLVDVAMSGYVVIEDLPSGGYIARLALTAPTTGTTQRRALAFLGPDDYLRSIRRAREQIERLEAEMLEPQDRG